MTTIIIIRGVLSRRIIGAYQFDWGIDLCDDNDGDGVGTETDFPLYKKIKYVVIKRYCSAAAVRAVDNDTR